MVKAHAIKIKEFREEFENVEGMIICANPECLRKGVLTSRKIRHRQCSRCRVTTYCSEKCQRRDWKTNHRVRCVEAILTNVDRQFMEWYAVHRSHIHRETITSLVQEQKGKTTMHIVYMDFRSLGKNQDPHLSTLTFENYNRQKCGEEGEGEPCHCAVLVKGLQSAGHEVVVQAVFHGEPGRDVLLIFPCPFEIS
ncbi:hypothetical protein D9758_013305 [Tetrapyrgos nigripes]|uniref:MYND-type domain-containing protein n=1 Tax=Tetrapyrgos nigripes TaxID=182062 RepID=A0A8H5FK13_9AGAR|nr:hypothetical protein D9758_013305 [Tetrapyrgos nigripes]